MRNRVIIAFLALAVITVTTGCTSGLNLSSLDKAFYTAYPETALLPVAPMPEAYITELDNPNYTAPRIITFWTTVDCEEPTKVIGTLSYDIRNGGSFSGSVQMLDGEGKTCCVDFSTPEIFEGIVSFMRNNTGYFFNHEEFCGAGPQAVVLPDEADEGFTFSFTSAYFDEELERCGNYTIAKASDTGLSEPEFDELMGMLRNVAAEIIAESNA